MKLKKTFKGSEEFYDFLYDVQSNVGILQKEKNIKRTRIKIQNIPDYIMKYFKFDNDSYKKFIKLVMEEENGNN